MKKSKLIKFIFICICLLMTLHCFNGKMAYQGNIIRSREGVENYLGGAKLPATASKLFLNVESFMDVNYHLAMNVPEADVWPFIKNAYKIDKSKFKPISKINIYDSFKHNEWDIEKYPSALAYKHLEQEIKKDGSMLSKWCIFLAYDKKSGRFFWQYSTF